MSADAIADQVIINPDIATDPLDPKNVQAQSANGDKQPKRRGRPPGSKNKPKPEGASTPRRGRPPKADTVKAQTAEIAQALGMILAVPAIPAQMVGDQFLIDHFNSTGPQLGQILAEASERNPVLRSYLLRAIQGESVAVLAIGVIGYIVPPAVYFLTADGHPMRTAFNVPAQSLRRGVPSPHAANAESTESTGPTPVS